VRTGLTILLIFLSGEIFSQDRLPDFTATDNNILAIDAEDPSVLSHLLTDSCHTDIEKVRSIFRWITEHISYYRSVPRRSKRGGGVQQMQDNDDTFLPDTAILKSVTERVALKVLRDRKTYCDGYSRLFKSLCDHAGIESVIITGYARSDMNRIEDRFRSNHAWNAVYIDSAWHLLDVTWASGFIAISTGDFMKRYDDYYFLTSPDEFIKHHYPDDLRWTLLANTPTLYEFRYAPFHPRSYGKYDIQDYYPMRGIINATLGDTIHVELETKNSYRSLAISPDSLWDSTALQIAPNTVYIKPSSYLPGNKVMYDFPVNSEDVQWLHVMYNNDAVLRYRLNVKKPEKQ
jgi:hypothetical protein